MVDLNSLENTTVAELSVEMWKGKTSPLEKRTRPGLLNKM